MRRVSIFRSTPFRLALTFGILVMLAFVMAGGVSYRLLNQALAHKLDDGVNETYSVVASTYAKDDVEDLVSAINTYASLSSADRSLFAVEDKDGRRLAGNFKPPVLPDGLSTVEAEALGLGENGTYRIRSGTIDGTRLIVGQSFNEVERLSRVQLGSLLWAAVFAVVTAVGGGIFLAIRAQKRLDAVAGTMFDVSNGQLDLRIPLLGNGDDIDVVSSQINRSLDQLAALVEGMRQVSADIAHELKTPLNRLKLILDEAVDTNDSGGPVAALLQEARNEGDQINATFDALLRISQIEAGARRRRFQDVDLAAVVDLLGEIYVDVASDAGQTLVVSSLADRKAIVTGDRELLTQMFVNLIENAIRHCPPGSAIHVGLTRTAGMVVFTVSDDGPGIPRGEHDNVFQRLYRLDKSRTTPGSGLGLSLVKAIADLHDADVRLSDNKPGVRIAALIPARV
jgi:signal transduction histidine kinase